MTDRARSVGENLRACGRRTRSRLHRRFKLMLDPLVEIFGTIDEHPKSHIGMRIAAELGALSVVLAGSVWVGHQGDLILLARNNVALAANRGHEKAVDDVL